MNNLKKHVLFLLMAVLGTTLAIAPVHAQTARASANIPFDFVVGKTTLQAGSYRIEQQGSFVLLASAEGRKTYALLQPGSKVASRDGQPYLVFTRYGKDSFLNKIVFSIDNHYDLPRSAKEREIMAKLASGDQVAVLIQPARY